MSERPAQVEGPTHKQVTFGTRHAYVRPDKEGRRSLPQGWRRSTSRACSRLCLASPPCWPLFSLFALA
jgi:hypothetical protein